jgi:tetratricopeptide (TPR) repeat protein
MPALAETQPNTFQQTLLGLAYTDRSEPVDLFSRACVDQYRNFSPTRFGYLLTQVFEPNVLREVALLAGVPHASVVTLAHRGTPEADRLAELIGHRAALPLPGLVNLATALISVSRFDLAGTVLADAAERAQTPQARFEVAMLEFIIANRRDDGGGSQEAFARMRAAIEADPSIPSHRVLDACTQAVVWYLKRRELSDDMFRWFARTGHALVKTDQEMDSGAVSAWYRGLAMVPAARGDAEGTREYMNRSRAAADETIARQPNAYEMHLVKTYYESSIKEHMYVNRDLDRAVEAGRSLIGLDPTWAPSHGELGDAYLMFGRADQAAEMYDRALELGPPYYGHHLLQSARAHAKAGDVEVALERYRRLADLVPQDAAVLTAALEVARANGHSEQAYFARKLADLEAGAAGAGAAEARTADTPHGDA